MPVEAEHAQVVRDSVLEDPDFVRAVFSGVRGGGELPWRRVIVRPVALRGGRHLQFEYRDERTSSARNFPVAEAHDALDALIEAPFRNIQVESTTASVHVGFSKRGRPLMSRGKPSKRRDAPDLAHDRRKERPLPEGERDAYLEAIGIMARDGTIRAAKQKKYRQINEFIRAVTSLPVLRTIEERPLRVADLGCGNAYLSFAIHHYLNEKAGIPATLVGVDVREDLIERNRAVARELGWQDVAFECCPNADFRPAEPPHLTFALHACDTACDEAIAQAVKWGSEVIAVATCCHHHLQAQLEERDEQAASRAGERGDAFAAVRRHGLLRERLGDVLTDAFRVAILGALGYRTGAIEFVSPEHTPRNVLIRAERTSGAGAARALAEYDRLKAYWGVTPHLETLLGEQLEAARAGRLPASACAES